MFINSEDLKNYLVMTAACNGNAYRDSKNTARAIKEAKASALAAFTEHLREAAVQIYMQQLTFLILVAFGSVIVIIANNLSTSK